MRAGLRGTGPGACRAVRLTNSPTLDGKGRRVMRGALRSLQIRLMTSGFHGRKSVAVAVFRQRADIREAEMISGDHALFRDHAVEEGASRGFRLRRVGVEHHMPARIPDE